MSGIHRDRRGFLNVVGAGALGAAVSSGPASADATAIDAPDPDEYDAILEDVDGDGSEESPYVITDVVELQAMEADREAHYELGGDIDASDTEAWNDGEGFSPVGGWEFEENLQFRGTLHGQDHVIRELYIDRATDNVGLFGALSGEVENVSLSEATVSGDGTTGALVGYCRRGTVNSASATGEVSSGHDWAGGLVGTNEGTVRESSAASTVVGGDIVGGLVGSNLGDVTESSSLSNVTAEVYIGGLVGQNAGGTIANSTASGEVTADQTVGGLVGLNRSGATVKRSTASGAVSGGANIGGLVGTNGANVGSSAATGDVSGDQYVGGLVGNTWTTPSVTDSFATGDVSGDDMLGGIAGGFMGELSNSFAAGTVGDAEVAGGLVGQLGADRMNEDGVAAVRDSYWDAERTGKTEAVGTRVPGNGETAVDGVEGLSTSEMQGTSAEESMSAMDFDETWRVLADPDYYPELREVEFADVRPKLRGSGSSGDDGSSDGDGIPGFGLVAGIGGLSAAIGGRLASNRIRSDSER